MIPTANSIKSCSLSDEITSQILVAIYALYIGFRPGRGNHYCARGDISHGWRCRLWSGVEHAGYGQQICARCGTLSRSITFERRVRLGPYECAKPGGLRKVE